MSNLSYRMGDVSAPLLHDTIGQFFERTVRQQPDDLALVVRHQGIRLTYAEYADRVDQLAAAMLRIGIGKGDRVGMWAPNCVEWCLTQFATAKIGAILVCINPAYRVHELKYALGRVGCKALVTADNFKSSAYVDMLCTIAPELAHCAPGNLNAEAVPDLRTIISLGETRYPGMYRFDELMAQDLEHERSMLPSVGARLLPDDPINIQLTSGTTGNPKGATLTHSNILNNGFFGGQMMRLAPGERLCIPVPLYHCFGMVIGNLACITSGAAAVFPDAGFDPASTLEAVSVERCTALHGVPTMFIAILNALQEGGYDVGSLRTGVMAGAPCPEAVMRRVIDELNMHEVLIAYGQTETSPINHMTQIDDPLDARVSSVGRAFPHTEIKIADAEGNTLPVGEQGEICCRGYAVMEGYWGDQENTAATIDADGWLHSGDLGVMDDKGYVRITGRIKDMIIRGGENVYPREVEEFLYTHPAIDDVQVFGVPDDRYGEQVCAWVKLRPDVSLTEQELKDFCRGKITHFKVPAIIQFVDAFPSTVTGKPQKFVMREQMTAMLAVSQTA